ncbi:helix-turn-helix domain-containing protein [Nocardia sp. NPDC049149]|uniref:helix-turn-helix domain-containing protein n=1 Tax=Nocardia sp. NPDC049149 TaxID=3364315 RepID=UPI003712F726
MNHRDQGREALAQQLRQLRSEHPELSLRTIGHRAQVSHTTVSRALSTEDKLPSWSSIAAITRVLGGASGDVQPLWLWASAGTPPTAVDEPAPQPEPERHPWFVPACSVVTIGLIILAIAHNAIPAQSTADRWLGDVAQTVFATAATIAFGSRARRAEGADRRWLLLACLASACWTVAMVYWIFVHDIRDDHQLGTTVAEFGFHGYSLLMIVAMWLRLRTIHPTWALRMRTGRTVALIAVVALSVPSAIWILTALLDNDPDSPDDIQIWLTYLYPLADGALFTIALLAALSGARITQSRLLAAAFGAHAIASVLATVYTVADAATDLVASAEFGFTTFTALLALAAIAPTDNRNRPPRHLGIVVRVMQAAGLAAIAVYTLTLATGNLPPAITPFTAAALIILLVVALIASLHHPAIT